MTKSNEDLISILLHLKKQKLSLQHNCQSRPQVRKMQVQCPWILSTKMLNHTIQVVVRTIDYI